MNTLSLYHKMVAAAVVVAVLATLITDGGWIIWLAVVPALVVTTRIKQLLGD